MNRLLRPALGVLALALAMIVILFTLFIVLTERDEPAVDSGNSPGKPVDVLAQQARGAYLARAGNCAGCHTARGGAAYAGGLELPTPFGTFVTPNITPDKETGIGAWTAQDFWRALHHGKGRDGRPLYPAFPYTEYTKVTRDDADALFAFLQTVAPVAQRNAADRLHFPYNVRPLLYAWRALYFSPGTYSPRADQSAEWNRGAYLVQGLGHCNACHVTRNALGAAGGAPLGGGHVAGRSWYAPSLTAAHEAGSANQSVDDIARLLATGVTDRRAASGPMAEVIGQSLQHLEASDLRSIAIYLKALGDQDHTQLPPSAEPGAEDQARIDKGAKLYEKHCADCHGPSGEGVKGAYPALAGNPGVAMPVALNTIRSALDGGYPPSTRLNPRPYGMPPFAQTLSSEEIAQVVSYIRHAWGHRASMVSAVQVDKSGSD
jgi:mono/diheme cytochrome c family protein